MRAFGFAFLFLLPCTFAAPALKSGKPAYYHATEVGTVLEYEMTRGPGGPAGNSTMKDTITAVETKGTGLLVTSKRNTNGNMTTIQALVSETGVANIDPGIKTAGGSMQMLKLPLKANETWESTLEALGNIKASHKSIGEVEIEVPAGKFKAIKVELSYTIPGAGGVEMMIDYWYAPNVGMVKMAVKGNKLGPQLEYTLTSITPPKK